MIYLVFHNHDDGLVMTQQQIDMLFATGNVLDVREVPLSSLQNIFWRDIAVKAHDARGDSAYHFVGLGVDDRYGSSPVPMVSFDRFADVHGYCSGYRPVVKERDAEGRPTYTAWEGPLRNGDTVQLHVTLSN